MLRRNVFTDVVGHINKQKINAWIMIEFKSVISIISRNYRYRTSIIGQRLTIICESAISINSSRYNITRECDMTTCML